METAIQEAVPVTKQPEPIIELKRLTKHYDSQVAVNGLNLTIGRGEVFGLLGPNGAGKTTTILMMLGLTEPTSGSARICGLDPMRQALQVKRRVGYMPDDIGFYEDRTAIDNLMLTARLNRISNAEGWSRAQELLDLVGLRDAINKKVGAFSRGMRQRLGIADVLIKRPEVVILDEPTLGIDPEGVRELLKLISDLSRQQKITVLLSSHHLHQVQQICDRVGLFVRGELIACGDIESLANQLDDEGTVTVELEAEGWNEELIRKLTDHGGVITYRGPQVADLDSGGPATAPATLVCSRDLSSEVALAIIQSGARLKTISRKQYGLDDIYHRYFEGGERGERNRSKS
ncbi:ABC transporter ATP-binding protein [Paenibacillus sp. CCS19]|uniref:ABC transporter ATP-binding protein n=1 Tax=Paenibacillus sp. CCS19 TaxID=3158387 RepID=UPI00255D66A0|nr:ABC transporter ATP-binding protein [Paenibacillus cellulosilyticus]GMK37240.1 ABC transporter ATP-binding protein [Paenibacillus cellulosilyticus]